VDLQFNFKGSFEVTTDRNSRAVATRIAGLEQVIRRAVRDHLAGPGRSTGGDWAFKLRVDRAPRTLVEVLRADGTLGWQALRNLDEE